VRKAGPCRAGGAGCVRVGARGALGTQAIADTTDLSSCPRSPSALMAGPVLEKAIVQAFSARDAARVGDPVVSVTPQHAMHCQ